MYKIKGYHMTVDSNKKEHFLKQTLSFLNNISECKGLKRKKMWKVSSRSPLLSDILDQLQNPVLVWGDREVLKNKIENKYDHIIVAGLRFRFI